MKKNTKQALIAAVAALQFSTMTLPVTTYAAPTVMQQTIDQTGDQTADSTASVSIDAVHFPDENFRTFVQKNFDKDGDGVLSAEEIAAVYKVHIRYDAENGVTQGEYHLGYHDDFKEYSGIKVDFTGLEYFTDLTYIIIQNIDAVNFPSMDQFSKLEMIKCMAMPKLPFESFGKQVIEVVLKYIPIEHLQVEHDMDWMEVSHCQLKSIDLSKCESVEEELILSDNQLTDIKWPQNGMEAYRINLYNNQLKELDLRGLSLDVLNIGNNPFTEISKKTIKTDERTSIEQIAAHYLTKCKKFDVSQFDKRLFCVGANYGAFDTIKFNSDIKALGISGCKNLKVLNKKTMQVPDDSKLEELLVDDANLTTLNTSRFKNLTDLTATGNQLKELNISGNTKLSRLVLWDSKKGGNEKLKTIIANKKIDETCVTELKRVVKKTGGKITYVPEQVSGLKAVKKTKTTLKLRWNTIKGASGYSVYDASTGKKVASAANKNGAKTIEKTITGLKAQKKYSYRVRAYVTVDGKKYYGTYSKVYTKATAKQ